VVAWNQLGCLSPHVIYVENGGALTPEQFAEMLARQLAQREKHEPRGELPAESAAVIASKRAFYEIRAAHAPERGIGQREFDRLDSHLRSGSTFSTVVPQPFHLREARHQPGGSPAKRRQHSRQSFHSRTGDDGG
jgi:hypothetical protein